MKQKSECPRVLCSINGNAEGHGWGSWVEQLVKLSLWFIIGACTQQKSWEDRFWGSGAIIVASYQCYAMKHNYCCKLPVHRNETQEGATQMSRNAMKHRFVSQVPLVSPQQCHGWPVSGDLPLSALCTVYVRVMQWNTRESIHRWWSEASGGNFWGILWCGRLSVAFNCVTVIVKVVGSLHQHVKVMQRELWGILWCGRVGCESQICGKIASKVQHSVERSP